MQAMITAPLILNLMLILVAAWVTGNVFSRFGQPFLLGQLLAGLLLGPAFLGLIGPSEGIDLLADLGIFFVMFHSGMETDPKLLLGKLGRSLTVAAGGFVVPFALGYVTARFFGGTVFQSLFVGMGISISAIAVQVVILHDMKINRTALGHVIIGAAIADDILALIVLSVLVSVVGTGSAQPAEIALILIKVGAFFGATFFLGHYVVPRFTRRFHEREGRAFTFAITVALVLAFLAEKAGLHLIIGAFLAGQFIRKEIMDPKVYDSVRDRIFGISYGFLVPVFFASLSFHLHFPRDKAFLVFVVALIGVAVAGKLLGAGAGYFLTGGNRWEATITGFGMNGRGAVEMVVASVVLRVSHELAAKGIITEPLLTDQQFSALIVMAFVTTLIAPVGLKWAIRRACDGERRAEFCELLDTPE